MSSVNVSGAGSGTVTVVGADGGVVEVVTGVGGTVNATNVAAAGAIMDSEVDADIKTLALPANTTISTFGASLVDDADAATARTTLGLGTAATAATGDFAPAATYVADDDLPLSAALRPIPGAATLITGWDSGATVGGTGATVTADTSIWRFGGASTRIDMPSNTNYTGAIMSFSPVQDWADDAFTVSLRFSDFANLIDGYIIASTTGGAYVYQLLPDLQNITDGEWLDFTFTPAQFSVQSGTPDWSLVSSIYFQFASTDGQTPSIWVDQLFRTRRQARGIVSICFDDGFETDYTVAREILDNYGFKATTAVMVDRIGTSGYMDQDQIDELADIGWDISGHGTTNLTTVTLADATADIRATKRYLVDRGFKGADVYVWPLGDQNAALRTVASQYFGIARGTGQGGQTIYNAVPMNANTRQAGSSWTVADAERWIDEAAEGFNWLILTFHALRDPTETGEDVTPTNFEGMIDYLATADVDVLTISEALARTFAPTPDTFTVEHGATAGQLRPPVNTVVWKGTVEPTNGRDGDIWVDLT